MAPVAGGTEVDGLITRAQDAVRRNPDQAAKYNDLARAFVRKARESADPGFYVQAQDAVERALRVAPNDLDALQLQALLMLQDHRFGEVRDIARRLIARNASNPMQYGLLGDADMETGDYTGAEAAYQRMVDMRPNLPSYSRASWMRWLLGDPEGAVEVGRLAVDAGSSRVPEELAWVMVNLGNLYFATGDLEHALEKYETALHVFPDYPGARQGRGRVREARGDRAGAIEDFEAAARVSTLAEHLMALGEAQAADGKAPEAAVTFARLERIARRSDPRTLALYYANHDREHEAAVDLARREMANRGEEIYTQDVLAWALYRAGHVPEARDLSTRSRRLGTREARFSYHGGLIALAAGDRAEAARLLTDALAMNPHFDPLGAADARRVLATLGVPAPRAPADGGALR